MSARRGAAWRAEGFYFASSPAKRLARLNVTPLPGEVAVLVFTSDGVPAQVKCVERKATVTVRFCGVTLVAEPFDGDATAPGVRYKATMPARRAPEDYFPPDADVAGTAMYTEENDG